MARPIKHDPDNPFAGNTRCLGWCNQKFYSYDKRKDKFCSRCRIKKERAQQQMSKTHFQTQRDD